MTGTAPVPVITRGPAVPATRAIRDIPTEYRLGTNDGMSAECTASFDRLHLHVHLVERRCALDRLRLAEAWAALGSMVDC